MIEINPDKVADALASEEFKKELCEAFKSSTFRHARELHKIPKELKEADDFEYSVRADLVILRLESLLAERICDGMNDEDPIEPRMTFIFKNNEYLFELLEKILSADELLEYIKGSLQPEKNKKSGQFQTTPNNSGVKE